MDKNYKKGIFSKSFNVLILKFQVVFPTTHTILKSLKPAMEDFFFLKNHLPVPCEIVLAHRFYTDVQYFLFNLSLGVVCSDAGGLQSLCTTGKRCWAEEKMYKKLEQNLKADPDRATLQCIGKGREKRQRWKR